MRTAASLSAVTHTYPFGPEHDVFKVAGKVFLMATEAPGEQIVTLKCEPPHGLALRQEFPTITPGYHMNKRHWNTVTVDGDLPDRLVRELIEDSYDLVVAGLPRAERLRLDRP